MCGHKIEICVSAPVKRAGTVQPSLFLLKFPLFLLASCRNQRVFKSSRLRSNESPSGAFKRQNGLAQQDGGASPRQVRVCVAQRSNESPSGAFKRQNGLAQQDGGALPRQVPFLCKGKQVVQALRRNAPDSGKCANGMQKVCTYSLTNKNHPIPYRLDGIGLSGRTARSVFLLAKNSLLPVELSGQTPEQEVPVYLSSALFSALLRYCRGLCPVAFAKRVEKLLASPKPTSRAISLTLWSVRTSSSFACVMRKLTR